MGTMYDRTSLTLAGVDIETTGLRWNKDHRLIQIAVVTDKVSYFYPVKPEGPMLVDPEAMAVNKITLSELDNYTRQSAVDMMLSNSLMNCGYGYESITPVGWNVGSFDLGFIQKELPKTSEYFSRRVIDLTSLGRLYELRTGKSYRDLKTEMHAKAVRVLGRDERHNALFDAQSALLALDYFKELVF